MNNAIAENLRHDEGALRQALLDAGAIFKGKMIKCPFHDDQHPSSSMFCGEDGAWRFKCQTSSCGFSGDIFDVQAKAREIPVQQAIADYVATKVPKRQGPPSKVWQSNEFESTLGDRFEAKYEYVNPATRITEMIVYRIRDDGGKRFAQGHLDSSGGMILTAPPKPWPIYNRGRILKATSVVCVEGEKCVHALHRVGVVATTSPGGAGKAAYANWQPLAGKKVALWPDNDETGIKHMKQVQAILEKLTPAPALYWIEPNELKLPPKGDAADVVASCDDDIDAARRVVRDIITQGKALGAWQELGVVIEDTISGKRRALAWPWVNVGNLTKALLPASVVVLCGDPGATKSLLLLQAAAYWYGAGLNVAVYELEKDRAFHLHRA